AVCPSTTACAAAGSYTDSSGHDEGMLLTGSGSSWAATEAPLPADADTQPYVYLPSISCASATACTAAGFYYSTHGYRGLLVTRSGTGWTGIPAPLPADAATNPTNAQLDTGQSVSCPSAAACAAIGYYIDSSGYYQGLLLTGSGTTWTAVKAPMPPDAAA